MRDAPLGTRLLLASVALLGLLAYLTIVDLGVSAGKVHHGVTVEGYSVAGLTEIDARRAIVDRASEMELAPMVFTSGSFVVEATPFDLKWNFRAERTLDSAMAVGREGLFHSLWGRVRAWLGGTDIDWEGRFADPAAHPTRPRTIFNHFVRHTIRSAASTGITIDEAAFVGVLKAAFDDWPRADSYEIPLVGAP